MTLHVLFTPETKDPINKELLMKMPKDATPINVACPEKVHEAELLEDLSVRTDFLSHPQCARQECRDSQGVTKADSRIISIRAHRTVHRHPVVSTSNAKIR